jgi:hypothetical protein
MVDILLPHAPSQHRQFLYPLPIPFLVLLSKRTRKVPIPLPDLFRSSALDILLLLLPLTFHPLEPNLLFRLSIRLS